MNPNHLKAIDHVAIAVKDADQALGYYVDRLGLKVVGDEIADDPGVRLVYLSVGADRIQLVQPLRPGPVADWIHERGEGLHHICFEVEDIESVLFDMPQEVHRSIFRGGRKRRACFLGDTPEGVNLELTESQPKP
ncbi:VOC family protein [Paenarthrobacter sp. NPDC089675]|uniref:VOC family protein n=1 Tax=Paenarthrobacter sp. NPDC089675 TaxID=3364376 RepID=UPI00382B8921